MRKKEQKEIGISKESKASLLLLGISQSSQGAHVNFYVPGSVNT